MKTIILFFVVCFAIQYCQAQEVTPEIKQKLVAQIAKDADVFKKNFSKEKKSKHEIEYAVDTFKIERLCDKEMDVDPSTAGTNQAIDELTRNYDKLMNKYYNLLMAQLKGDDKKILVTTQRAWLTYRDAEAKLIGTVNGPTYTGGGTMYSTFTSGMYSKLISARTQQLFNYYNDLMLQQEGL